ncbi:unnamed protein product [Adineta steineri]|uniref:Uncharacterized protein n=1 Tax=Adineta steineri TaxID=433720 RepID=A0A814BX75_9BILA|nr:unnamed protein product [Adineta steineri]CAF1089166.1 unnamed protein product [Adineta steineri]
MKQRTTVPILSANKSYISSSSSNDYAYVNRIYLNRVFSSRLPLKRVEPESWQRFLNGNKLTIKENKPNIHTILNENYINLLNEYSPCDENFQKSSFLPISIQEHLDHLYKQMNDLTLELSNQQCEHKQLELKTRNILSNQLQDREKELQECLQRHLFDHEKKLKEQERKYIELLNKQQMQNVQREKEFKNKLDFIRNTCHTYKISLDKESTEKYQLKLAHDKKRTRKHKSKIQN